MQLIIISPPIDYPDEPQVVCRILEQTSVRLHLRKPGMGDQELAGYLQHIPSILHHRVMVHDHWRLLDGFALKGIHFSEKQRRAHPLMIRQIRLERKECRISSAFHRISHIPDYDGSFDYIFLSPIFNSISK